MRHFIICYFKPIIWRIDSDRKPYFLQDFSMLELDSAWQSMNAIPKVSSQSLKSNLFQQLQLKSFIILNYSVVFQKNTARAVTHSCTEARALA